MGMRLLLIKNRSMDGYFFALGGNLPVSLKSDPINMHISKSRDLGNWEVAKKGLGVRKTLEIQLAAKNTNSAAEKFENIIQLFSAKKS